VTFLLEQSAALHSRVRAFAACGAEPDETFEQIAIDIARFQQESIPGFRRLVESRGVAFERVEEIPPVPTEVFRLARVAVHSHEVDRVRFLTSGTTGTHGTHVMRTTDTYRALALRFGHQALASSWSGPCVVVALAPAPGDPPTSSLGYMMRLFMEAWDGRALVLDPTGASFNPLAPDRWLTGSGGVDVGGLRRAALVAQKRKEPFIVLATSFALVALLDMLAGGKIPAPKRTVVMQTGGFKGRTRTVSPGKLRAAVARAFRIPKEHVIGEYGMTELTSQLYEGTLRDGALSGPAGVYLAPPWLRVTPVDPATLRPVPAGQVGLAKFVDLGNVDSAVAVLTQDLVRCVDHGIELIGRQPRSVPRGCSLSAEVLLRGAT
jgi:hypothetical protein